MRPFFMRPIASYNLFGIGVPLVIGLLSPPLFATPKTTTHTHHPTKNHLNETLQLNFSNTEISDLAKALAAATGRTIQVDPRVKGQLNLITEQAVSRQHALNLFGSLLRMQGFALVEAGNITKIVPEAEAKLQNSPVSVQSGNDISRTQNQGEHVTTHVFRLQHESANALLPVLRPLVAPNNIISAYPANNTLVITDYAANLQRIGRLIAAIDTPLGSEVEIIPLQHALAIEVAALVNRLLDPTQTGNADTTLKTLAMADPRTNSVVLRATSAARLQQAKVLLGKLDQPGSKNGTMWVVPLRNAEATRLAPILRALVAAESTLSPQTNTNTNISSTNNVVNTTPATSALTTSTSNNSSGSGNNITSSSSAAQTGGIIQADPSSNALIITAPEPLYRNLRTAIERLDVRRPQIYVESMIVEVSSESMAEFGLQWQGLLGGSTNKLFVGTNFSSAGSNIVTMGTQAQGILSLGNPTSTTTTTTTNGVTTTSTNSTSTLSTAPGKGLNIGWLHNFGGVFGLAALARVMESQTGVNVLSTPNLLTLDNEEAKITIGQNVPFITGQYAQTGSTSSVSPFQTIERRDVGLTLRVKPQITDGGLVRLQIFQESSSVSDTTNSAGIITNKRSIESQVLAEDGQIIALGGLLEDSYRDGAEKVPGLGNLPLIGKLFRYENKRRTKTNLMVFLRPYVIRSSAQSDAVVTDRYDLVRSAMGEFTPATQTLSDENKLPTLPTLNQPTAPFIERPTIKP
jgi:general secretion pathway protein D